MLDSQRSPSRDSTDDPRYRRVRQQLVGALLRMAGQQPAQSISVKELTAAAGVSRASFYAHASTPAGLLAETLIAELRPGLTQLSGEFGRAGADHGALWRRTYLALLDHVAEHREVYRVISSGESPVSSALTRFFEEVTGGYVQVVAAHLVAPPATPLWRTMATTQQAHSMLAVVHAWILTGFADAPDDVVDTYLSLAPPWQLARADASGQISLHRARISRSSPEPTAGPPGTTGPDPA